MLKLSGQLTTQGPKVPFGTRKGNVTDDYLPHLVFVNSGISRCGNSLRSFIKVGSTNHPTP